MIQGYVDADYQCIISLQIRTANGQFAQIEAAMDTGFSGYLTLPPSQVAAFGLAFKQKETYELGDHREVEFDIYLNAKWLFLRRKAAHLWGCGCCAVIILG